MISLLSTAVVQAARPMASYRALELGGSFAEVGFVAASYGMLSLLLAVPIGRRVDRHGETLFMVVGGVLIGLSVIGAGVVDSILLLSACLALLGLGHVALTVGVQTMIANHGSQDDRDRRFGVFAVVQSLGQLIGPAAAGIIASTGSGSPSLGLVFAACAVASSLTVLVALSFVPGRRSPARRPSTEGQAVEAMAPAMRRVLAVPSMGQALLAGITVVTCVNVLIAYLPAYGVATGLPVEVVGLLLSVRAGASMTSRLSIGYLRRRMARKDLLAACLLAPAFALLALSFVSGVAILFVAMIVVGFGLGLGQPLTLSWIAGQAPTELRGTAVSMRVAGNRLGQSAVPASLGLVAGVAGVSGVFGSLGLLLLLSAVLVSTGPFAEPVREQVPTPERLPRMSRLAPGAVRIGWGRRWAGRHAEKNNNTKER